MKKQLSASILSADFSKLSEEILAVEAAGIDQLHLDVMDGHFVPNITIGSCVIESIRKITALYFHTHLMVQNPDPLLESFANAGSNLISVHAEVCGNKTLQKITSLGKSAGIAINPATPISVLDSMYDSIDLVLVMSVNPGFGGQKFIPETLPKIESIREEREKRNLSFLIEVDGGVKADNIHLFSKAGADIIVSGSGIFKQKNYRETINNMKKIVGQL